MILRLAIHIALLAALLIFTCGLHEARAERRVALVIGNSAYVNTPRLENPRNDASDLAAALQQLGFEVVQGRDLDKAGMDRTIRGFAEMLPGADLALFFYAGHGLQINGANYLVPIDARLTTAAALDFEMVRLDVVQRAMEQETTSSIIMLDACRDNPLARNLARALGSKGSRSMSIGRGLAEVKSGGGTLISFSTQPDNVALDGSGRNSPYAAALLKHIAAPGEDLPTILIEVRKDVIEATAHRPVPWEHSALTAKIYFTAPKPAGPTHEQQVEMTFWNSVKDSASPAVLGTYLDRYPQGEFAAIARALTTQYEQRAKAELAAREEDQKRQEEARKQAELQRLENERQLREKALEEERLRAQRADNDAETKRIERQEVEEHKARAEELRKALAALREAREEATRAEEQRLAAVKSADEAAKAAAATVASKRDAVRHTEPTKMAALPQVPPPATRGFDGRWTFTRSVEPGCGSANAVFFRPHS